MTPPILRFIEDIQSAETPQRVFDAVSRLSFPLPNAWGMAADHARVFDARLTSRILQEDPDNLQRLIRNKDVPDALLRGALVSSTLALVGRGAADSDAAYETLCAFVDAGRLTPETQPAFEQISRFAMRSDQSLPIALRPARMKALRLVVRQPELPAELLNQLKRVWDGALGQEKMAALLMIAGHPGNAPDAWEKALCEFPAVEYSAVDAALSIPTVWQGPAVQTWLREGFDYEVDKVLALRCKTGLVERFRESFVILQERSPKLAATVLREAPGHVARSLSGTDLAGLLKSDDAEIRLFALTLVSGIGSGYAPAAESEAIREAQAIRAQPTPRRRRLMRSA